MSILEARGIWRRFPVTGGSLEVLRGLDLRVERGEVLVIIGASGTGKSTLLHLLGTLDAPSEGTILIGGRDPSECSESELNRIRNRDLGFVFQFHYLLPEFNALENVMMPAFLGGIKREEAEGRAVKLLGEVGLADRISHRPAELSGGEQQRVAVARALMNNPAIVLADEPSGNLDDLNSDSLHGLIRTLCDSKGQTFVIVTHKRSLREKADRTMVLEEGKLREVGKDTDEMPGL